MSPCLPMQISLSLQHFILPIHGGGCERTFFNLFNKEKFMKYCKNE